MPKNNGKQNIKKNLKQANIKKYIACSYDHKLVCTDKFSKPFKTYLDKNAVYNLTDSIND